MEEIAYKNILVPIDEKQLSKRVIDHALHIADKESGKLIIVYVERKKTLECIFPKELAEKMMVIVKENIEANMDYALENARKTGAEVEKIILDNDGIAKDLIRIAEENNVNLTIMGFESLRSGPLGSITRWYRSKYRTCSRHHRRRLIHAL
ncbi:universal stress protein [Methanococcoides alaskense]|uniref:Nucleotide-binding universal stress UspA family protein n=1 Tax=Methanococcoides alaskense TaxID=325778 RepID=A0AA90TZE5_9EURY|nr:universal stress protein [Methanococcoides alaskense]MDA0525531.1 universal stress protein [Methanococcoides alaskense]MDR6222991.1 nucleotide-binding universal stress UspA family protein [Methanococcoides alaskense]